MPKKQKTANISLGAYLKYKKKQQEAGKSMMNITDWRKKVKSGKNTKGEKLNYTME